MSLDDFILDSIRRSVDQVFSTMLGVEIQQGDSLKETGALEANDGVVSLIGVAGSWAGTGSITCSPALACRICATLLMTESTAVDEEVLDAVAELTNMVIGNVKTDLESQLGPLGLSIPTVVYGRNFRTKSAGHAEWTVVHFRWEEELLIVKLYIAPNDKSAHAAVTHTQTCPIEV